MDNDKPSLSNFIAVIVDGYSTGAALAGKFARYGVKCVHVQSSLNVPSPLLPTFRPEDYFGKFVWSEGPNSAVLLSQLAELNPLCVVAGTETGVRLADHLAYSLGLVGNDPYTSNLRRNKFEMHQTLIQCGLSNVVQKEVDDVNLAASWARHCDKWPMVVKPPESAGADSVAFCQNPDEVASAASKILGTSNQLGTVNETVLLQQRIEGQQYIVNAVSLEGRHYFSEVWRDDRYEVPGASLISDREELLSSDHEVVDILTDYVARVLDRLGVREGASHSELFYDGNQPVLVETGARMQGTIDHQAVSLALDYDHVSLSVLRYCDEESFSHLLAKKYKKKKCLQCVTLRSFQEGTILANNCLSHMRNLQSFVSLLHSPNVGEKMKKTVDFFTNPGIVYLCSHDNEQLEKDYLQIRAWERDGDLFAVSE